jgi:hypothetical protein
MPRFVEMNFTGLEFNSNGFILGLRIPKLLEVFSQGARKAHL